jgi:hypothetical protein
MGTNSNYALRMPTSLKQSVANFVREDGSTLNQFIVCAVSEKLAALKTADYFSARAAQGNPSDALALLSRVSHVPPVAGDEWDAEAYAQSAKSRS